MKISLITVCYNSAATIRGAMESVAAQRRVREAERSGGSGEEIDVVAIRDVALKPMNELAPEDRLRIARAIEATDVVALRQPTDERMRRFVKGYWDGDAKTIREIVAWGVSVIPPSVENRYIGEIQTHKNSIRSILFHTRFRGPLKVLVLERLKDILRNAVLFNKGVDGDETFYNLAHRLSFDPGDGNGVKEFVVRLIVKETADGNRTWTIEFSNKKELTGVPTTGEAATVEVTRLKPPSTHTILKWIYGVNERPAVAKGLEIEYIVVDGGSTDGTVELIRAFAERMSAIEQSDNPNNRTIDFKWSSERDRGMYDALNKGIAMATGDVVGILNADDRLEDERVLADVAEAFECCECSECCECCECSSEKNRLEAIYGDVRFVRGESRETVRYYCSKPWKPWMHYWGYMPAHPTMYVRREVFEKYGGYKLGYDISADFEWMVRILCKAKIRAKYLPRCMVTMRLGGKSTAGLKAMLKLNRENVRANRENGYFCCLPMMLPKYAYKILGYLFRK